MMSERENWKRLMNAPIPPLERHEQIERQGDRRIHKECRRYWPDSSGQKCGRCGKSMWGTHLQPERRIRERRIS